ncbi:glycoside hydrolase family 43 protein [Pontiella sp.]|uniref:glycoside hydrolase family 43 protein n=1 Tax=Pontiella sp. TaxID=2837462 RepID=UPI003568A5A0
MRRLIHSMIVLNSLLAGQFALADNPIISQRYSADPNAIVHDGRVYVYCSNDEHNRGSYALPDYTLISSDDMVNWTDHGIIFKAARDTSWATRAFAPACIERNGKFYLYFPDGGDGIGVAVADRPEGPFVDPLNRPLIDKTMPNCDMEWCFDPCVFIDKGQAWLIFGGGKNEQRPIGKNFSIIKLNEDMISTRGEAVTLDTPGSFEGPFVHTYEGNYYLSYPERKGHHIGYIMSSNLMFTDAEYKGVVLINPMLDGKNINGNNNSHESIVQFQGQWYMFYHDRRLSGGKSYFRNVCVDRLAFNEDGTMQRVKVTHESVPQIKPLNPYEVVQAETIDRQQGIEVESLEEGGCMVTAISDGDWIQLSGVDFESGASKVIVQAAAAGAGGKIEFRLGSPDGELAGICTITKTGDWNTWKTFSGTINHCKGTHDLYMIYRGEGEPFRLDRLRFMRRK